MSRRVGTPVNQVKLSNVCVVRTQRLGLRFEVAAYPSKVVDWRAGVETDLDEVLQVRAVFRNVSKGVLSPAAEVEKAFGTSELDAACKLILRDGELQVSETERASKSENLFHDIATIVSEKALDPRTGRALPVAAVERAMRDELHFAVAAARSAKQQALEVLKKLEALGCARRAPMKLRVACGAAPELNAKVCAALRALEGVLEVEAVPGGGVLCLAAPRVYRAATVAVQLATGGAAVLEVLEHSAKGQAALSVAGLSAALDDAARDDAAARDATASSELPATSDLSTTTSAKNAARFADDTKPDTKPQKLSKTAKRKEKEEAKERAERAAAEIARRERRERARAPPPGAQARDDTQLSANPDTAPPAPPSDAVPHKLISCTTCGGAFASAAEHREHFRSDWHRANLKRKLAGAKPISEAEFALDADHFG